MHVIEATAQVSFNFWRHDIDSHPEFMFEFHRSSIMFGFSSVMFHSTGQVSLRASAQNLNILGGERTPKGNQNLLKHFDRSTLCHLRPLDFQQSDLLGLCHLRALRTGGLGGVQSG